MQLQSAFQHEQAFNLEMENLLQESRRALEEQAHLISLEIDSRAASAKEDVHRYLSDMLKM